MRVNIRYIASSGNVYDLQANRLLTRAANYHVWEWAAVGTGLKYGMKISAFTKEPAVYTTQLVFRGPVSQRKETIDALHEDFERDIRNMKPGRIIWRECYIECYITASSTVPDQTYLWTNNDITIYCPYPFWIKEETRTFMPQEAPGEQQYLDYDFDYEYDYFYGNPGIAIWQLDFPFPSEFRMTVFGPAVNPRVLINGYPYQFNDTLEAGEYVVIDSRSNKITKHLVNGYTVNIFDLRNKAHSIFEPIPGCNLTFNWSGQFGFDLTLYEERSEPRWT
jgi:hypothetical protein